MAITTFSELKSAVANWLARDDLILRIPEFITMAEAKFNRLLFVRQMETRSTTSADTSTDEPEFITLPTDFQSMRRIRLSGVAGKPRLEFLDGAQADEQRNFQADTAGQPRYFTIIGSELELIPTPDSNYAIEMVYRAYIPALSDGTTGNWLLDLAPDLYLYGALLESAPHIKEDQRIPTWALAFSSALDGLNDLGKMSAYNAGPMQMRVSGQTP